MFASFFFFFFKFNSLCPSQQFFSYLGTGLPGLNQYLANDYSVCFHDNISLNRICLYVADLISRQYFLEKNISRIRVKSVAPDKSDHLLILCQ